MSTESKPEPVGVDTLLEALNIVQEQVRFADSKASLIAAFHVALFGFMATQADALKTVVSEDRGTVGFWIRVILLSLYGGCAVTAFIFAVLCVWPRMGEAAPQCAIHATHVASYYKRNYQKYCDDLAKMDSRTWGDQIATQIVENSNIAVEKFRLVGLAAKWTVAAIVLWAAMLVATSLS